MMRRNPTSRRGFTLIELSVVLVVIGLIVGGVLVGQALIKAATIRKLLSEISELNTAVNTFRGKYGTVPGDLSQSEVTQFGLGGLACTGTLGIRDNGMIEMTGQPGTSCSGNYACACEQSMFAYQLAQTGTVRNTLFKTTPAYQTQLGYVLVSQADTTQYLWPANWYASGIDGNTWIVVQNSESTLNFVMGSSPERSDLAPRDAFHVDIKIDDGLPLTGTVRNVDMYGNVLGTDSGTICALYETNAYKAVALDSNDFCRLAFRSTF